MTDSTPLLLVAEYFPPDTDYAAFAERCRALAEELGSNGFSVQVMVLRRSLNDPPAVRTQHYHLQLRNPLASTFFRQNFPTNTIQRFWAFFDIMKVIRRTRSRLVVISAHDPMHYVAALTAGRIARIPTVTDAHDSRLVLGASTSTLVRRAFKLRVERFAMRRADRVWVPTEGLAKLIEASYAIPASHFRVVANGVDIKRFPTENASRNEGHLLLHLGGPRAYYDSATLVRAFRGVVGAVPDATLVFLGVRNDSYSAAIQTLCRDLGINDAVQFLPPAPPEAISAFTKRAAIGIHTYALEPVYGATIGLKIMEYMAAGLPVLHRGPRDGETWNLVQREGVGACAETEEELAQKAIELLRDPDMRRRLGDQGRAAVPQYEWTATLEAAVTDARVIIGTERDGSASRQVAPRP